MTSGHMRTMLILAAVLAVPLAGCTHCPARVTGNVVDFARVERGANGLVTMENSAIRLVVDPAHGGSVVSFIHKPLGEDVIPPERGHDQMGLMLDHYWEDGWAWPGEMMPASYGIVECASNAEGAVLRMRHTLAGAWAGKSDPKVSGLVFEKTFRLRPGVDALFLDVSLSNPTAETKMAAYWAQNYFHAGGDYDADKDIFSRPTTTGIFRRGRATGRDFVWDMPRAWSAATDTRKDTGLVWLMDYDCLNSLYNFSNSVTLEWVCDRALIPSGKTWRTEVVLLPFDQVRDISFASRNLIAGLSVARDAGGAILLTHSLRQGIWPAEDVQLQVEVCGGTSSAKADASLAVGRLQEQTVVLMQKIVANVPDPLIVKVRATGRSAGKLFEESYWDFYKGSYGYGGNVQVDMVTPLYQEQRPEKRPILLKPDDIRRMSGPPLFYAMMGLYADRFRMVELFRLAGQDSVPDGMPSVGEYSLNTYGMGPQISEFPFDYDKLMRYDAIVVANAHIDCLGAMGKEMLGDYVTHGGGLLVLGGMASYSASGWKRSALEPLLPIELKDSMFDLDRVSDGKLRLGEPHAITRGLDLSASPRSEYMNTVKSVKPGARVLLYAGERPFLVVWEKNGGRVACILGAPYGPDAGQFFNWDGWQPLMQNLLRWLGNRELL